MKIGVIICLFLLTACQKVTKFDIDRAKDTCGEVNKITFLYKDGATVIVKCDHKENTVVAK